MNINDVTKDWSFSRVKDIKKMLANKNINKTGRLSRSIRTKLNGGDNINIEAYWVYYGKYVRNHYRKKGFDIVAPLKDVTLLKRDISVDLKKQIIKEIQEKFKDN